MSRLFLVAEVLFGLGLDLEAVVGFKVTVSDITGDQSNRNKGPARLRSPGQSTQEHDECHDGQSNRENPPAGHMIGGVVVVALVIFENDQVSNDGAQGYRQGEVAQDLTDIGDKDKEDGQGALHDDGERRGFVLGMNFAELGEPQTVAG